MLGNVSWSGKTTKMLQIDIVVTWNLVLDDSSRCQSTRSEQSSRRFSLSLEDAFGVLARQLDAPDFDEFVTKATLFFGLDMQHAALTTGKAIKR